ncbi:hypothetical protein CRE_24110 [Caenorhabditis remanei]|uniref:Uncharacterized protein n=1 Tax=Caenorhabditis remanei TaxID=31234 RepID=E3MVM3_CAERE|nr:hypothetical protein CRE_24110 [Caenorhabditis remanei]
MNERLNSRKSKSRQGGERSDSDQVDLRCTDNKSDQIKSSVRIRRVLQDLGQNASSDKACFQNMYEKCYSRSDIEQEYSKLHYNILLYLLINTNISLKSVVSTKIVKLKQYQNAGETICCSKKCLSTPLTEAPIFICSYALSTLTRKTKNCAFRPITTRVLLKSTKDKAMENRSGGQNRNLQINTE